MNTEHTSEAAITFLGTAGARFMVTKQLAASGGIWLNVNGTQALIDPGPGSIVQSTKRKMRAEKLSAIILTHRHLDHSADVNIMVEAMTEGGFNKHGWFFAPQDALETEPILFTYLRGNLDGIQVLTEGDSYTVGDISFTTPLRHMHPAETYGLRFNVNGHTFSYITDTRYFNRLADAYANSEMVIMNVVLLEPKDTLGHLSVVDAERLIKELKPKVAILTHYGMHVWHSRPWLLAEKLTEQTGVKVIAARDGMKFDLSRLDIIE